LAIGKVAAQSNRISLAKVDDEAITCKANQDVAYRDARSEIQRGALTRVRVASLIGVPPICVAPVSAIEIDLGIDVPLRRHRPGRRMTA
jgi:hypothetical protein